MVADYTISNVECHSGIIVSHSYTWEIFLRNLERKAYISYYALGQEICPNTSKLWDHEYPWQGKVRVTTVHRMQNYQNKKPLLQVFIYVLWLWETHIIKRKRKESNRIRKGRHQNNSRITHINNHLIYFTYVYLLNGGMARYFTQDTTISTSNYQNLKKKVPLKPRIKDKEPDK